MIVYLKAFLCSFGLFSASLFLARGAVFSAANVRLEYRRNHSEVKKTEVDSAEKHVLFFNHAVLFFLSLSVVFFFITVITW